MFRITLARAATAITLSFTGAVTAGTLIPAQAATTHNTAYLDAAAVTARSLRYAAGCTGPDAPAGTTITVDSHGDASAPAQPGRLDYACTAGTWRRITIPATRHPLPSWLHARRIPGACGRGHAGVMIWASHADQSVVVCQDGAVLAS